VGLTRRALLASPLLAAGPRSLFDGHSTVGWKGVGGQPFPAHCWTVADGCLKALVTKPTFQDIRTVEEFEDFDFEFEWKIAPAGNSGVKYLIYREDVWAPPGTTQLQARGRGFEYQLADDAAMKSELDTSGGLYEFLAPSRLNTRPVGQFNASRIVRRGTYVEHWLNGLSTVKVQLDSPATLARMHERKVPAEFPKRTPIVLQNHSSETWFRHLRIRKL
jgi:hypothetical protein